MSGLLGALARPWPALAFRLAVGGFFAAAGLGKLARPAELFAAQIRSFGLVPEAWALPLARVLPWAELLSGGLLIAGLFTGAAAAAVAVQLGLFSAVLGIALAAGKAPEDCGCLPGLSESPGQALARDVAMLVWTALAAPGLPGRLSLDGWMSGAEKKED